MLRLTGEWSLKRIHSFIGVGQVAKLFMAGFHALLTAVTSAREKLEERIGSDCRDDLSSDGAVDASVCSDSSPDRSSSPEGYDSSASSSARGKKRPGAGTREQHNRLEKNRRAQQRSLLSSLKKTIGLVDKKASHLSVLQTALCEVNMLKERQAQLCQMEEQLLSEREMLQCRLSSLQRQLGPERAGQVLTVAACSSWRNRLSPTQKERLDRVAPEKCEPARCPIVIVEDDEDEDEEVDVTTEDHLPCLLTSREQETRHVDYPPSPPMHTRPILLEAHALTHNNSCLLMKIPRDAKIPFGYSSSQTLVTVSPEQLKETCSHAGLLYRHGDQPAFPVFPQGWLCT